MIEVMVLSKRRARCARIGSLKNCMIFKDLLQLSQVHRIRKAGQLWKTGYSHSLKQGTSPTDPGYWWASPFPGDMKRALPESFRWWTTIDS
jgi:hypothetical protein